MKIIKSNPENVAPPIGQYHHVAVIPKDAELVVLSGQIGNDTEGFLPQDVETQFANALTNIKSILMNEGIDSSNVFKVNIWLTEDISRELFNEKWSEFHHQSPPATTMAYVSALARPEIKVEVEAWAAK
ncbi:MULTISPECIES: RidA family protein [unclassified Bacillus (in: firmicutes)]|uniref:RidA family protein n=1 Tax=unclassified Bacillus (in: firmicutes) TaxID=185979 RepID=UPI0008EF238C|nr:MULTISPECIES: RidA family protein [unclassified Bacillus (in: firmicutes)]SFA70441.1 Enamine deaminase RidA, house cleaning of reactive enamine intermediates, YjgF/YER057c/UK114 family [Bacillus sp. UNCCL13]SFQ60216.1 Enamine deaminase RidA, house cleaning of reactive enamine intermediates, YjgF/YER057c/UK114 family [Bacillus sp. cl95]